MDLGLKDRTYIVTGASRGLGYAVAETLAAEEANVLVVSRTAEAVREAAERLGSRARGMGADLREPEAPGRLVEKVRSEFGALHGAFVSHGGPTPGPALDLEDETLRDAFELSALGPIRLVREVARDLPEDGSIVLLTSWSSVEPVPGLASSNVTRPGTWGYVKTLAGEIGPRGVRVNAMFPGRFATERQIELQEGMARKRGTTRQEILREVEQEIPLRRMGEPPELGKVAAFLLSPAASYVTGAGWLVDGGLVRGL
jgi:3-oxoacyl-[acyl-carrier protein] reductase